ncbi:MULTISPECIES: ABC transporter permease subunit [unclassified Nocardioides]|uniref:ABC transporter permease subunit n=1 Tax=unclassified Nocardioides TaxID=2615069 RepID=UPI000700D807|nr:MULTISPECIES: ABC transporter permease subunit [unclassified Nocardioides]KQY63732.1 ABC transporter permease [Nocardioides sp. Root140]KRF15747.1 ABC transporter permease [Nocardioides sp. Soil796]
MTTLTQEAPVTSGTRPAKHAPIPLSRIMRVELIKMFDTRSGFWLMASIGIAAVLATAATIIFAPESELDYEAFATAIGFPIAIILPIIGLLSVTSEWSQRTGLTTFTLLPNRSLVINAKLLVAVGIGVVSMFLAMAIGAVGNIVGTAIAGVDTTWNVSAYELSLIVLANVLGMLIGSMLGVLIRNSAGAIVGYFVYNALLPTLFMTLGNLQEWFRDLWPWVDFAYAQGALFNGDPSGEDWAHLAVTTTIWLIIPLVVGLFLIRKSEVK